MRLALRITIIPKKESPREWTSPEFDTADSETWCGALEPSAELLNIPSDSNVVFALVGDSRIADDPSWAVAFKINSHQNTTPSLSYNNKGVFEYRGNSAIGFFENAESGVFVRLGMLIGKDKKGKNKYGSIFEVPATVVDCSGRRAMYLKMLEEILSVNPGLALPDDDRMAVPRLFDVVFPEFTSGDTEVSSELLRYRDLSRDLDLLVLGDAPLLRAIEMRPITSQSQGERFVPFGKVRRVTCRHLNVIQARGIDDRDVDAERCVVTEDVFTENLNTIANRAIKTFLDDVLYELAELKRSFDWQYDVYAKERKKNPKIVGQRYNQRLITLKGISDKVSDICVKIRRYMVTSKMWSTLTGKVNVLDRQVHVNDFSATAEYLRVYWILYRHYMRKHWLKTAEGEHYVADYEVRESPVGVGRQRSYDFMYESWVFVRLLMAFSKNGFMLRDAYTKLLEKVRDVFMGLDENESVVAEARDSELRVGVTYGVTEKYTDTPLTPDFAIEIEDVRTHKLHVIILDAKAKSELRSCDEHNPIVQRDKYLRMTWNGPQNYPNQSWLVYMGDINAESGRTPAIEFSRGEGMSLENLGQKWDGYNGIVGVWSDRTGVVGHLRVNCNSIIAKDVFDEFVAGQIATARRHI